MARLTESQRETFEALRRAYLADVPARIAAIRKAAAEAGRRGAALEDLRHLVHQLVGSSAIFGLPELAAAARALEDLVTALLEGSARSLAELDGLTAALETTWRDGATPRHLDPKG